MKIYIAPYEYEVVFIEGLKRPNGEPASGHNSPTKMFIEIEANLDPQLQKKVLLHEIIEVVGFISGLKSRILKGEEIKMHDISSALDNGLLQVLRDNPDLFGKETK